MANKLTIYELFVFLPVPFSTFFQYARCSLDIDLARGLCIMRKRLALEILYYVHVFLCTYSYEDYGNMIMIIRNGR